MLQAAALYSYFTPSSLPPPQLSTASKTMAMASTWRRRSPALLQSSTSTWCLPIDQTDLDTSAVVDYSSITSVFPAEACETVGGDACDAEMYYPEVKLIKPDSNTTTTATTSPETVDRDYLDYNTPRTVFPGEACDDLGGEFCDPEYQKGVF